MWNSKTLILDNHDSFTWNLAWLLRSIGIVDFDVISSSDFRLPVMESYGKIIFSPGPGLPEEQPAMAEILKQVEDAYGRREPTPSILGVCLGMQAIATWFGGRLVNLPKVVHGQPRILHILRRDHLLFQGFPEDSQVGLYHSWAVDPTALPGCLDVLASSSDGTIMALAHKVLPVIGVQFHPESVITTHGKLLMENWYSKNLTI